MTLSWTASSACAVTCAIRSPTDCRRLSSLLSLVSSSVAAIDNPTVGRNDMSTPTTSGEDRQLWLQLQCRQHQIYNYSFQVWNGYEQKNYGGDSTFVSIWRHICVKSYLGNFENVLVWPHREGSVTSSEGFWMRQIRKRVWPHRNFKHVYQWANCRIAWKKSNMSSNVSG
jgi:hypothetical protein